MAHERRAALAALLLLAACTRTPASFETVELVHRVTGRQERETVTFGADAIRYQRPDGVWIFRYADRTVLSLDPEEKTWSTTSLDQFLAGQKEKELQPDVPELLGEGGAASLEIERDPKATEVAGLRAERTAIRSGRYHVELLLTRELVPPGPRRATFEFLRALGGPLALPAELFDHLEGFPLRSVVRVKGGMLGEMKVTRAVVSLDRSPVPASVFAVPEGYRRRETGSPEER